VVSGKNVVQPAQLAARVDKAVCQDCRAETLPAQDRHCTMGRRERQREDAVVDCQSFVPGCFGHRKAVLNGMLQVRFRRVAG